MKFKPEFEAVLDTMMESATKVSKMTNDPSYRAMAVAAAVFLLIGRGTPAEQRPASVSAMLAGAEAVMDDPRFLAYIVAGERKRRSHQKTPDKELAELRKMVGFE